MTVVQHPRQWPTRDEIVDYVDRWSERTERPAEQLLALEGSTNLEVVPLRSRHRLSGWEAVPRITRNHFRGISALNRTARRRLEQHAPLAVRIIRQGTRDEAAKVLAASVHREGGIKRLAEAVAEFAGDV